MKPSKLPRDLSGGGAKKFIEAELKEIIIPVIDFEDTSIEEAIDFLRQRSLGSDRERGGVAWAMGPREKIDEESSVESDGGGKLGGEGEPGVPKIRELHLKDVTLWDALHRIADETGLQVEITDYGIEMRSK